MHFFYYKYTKKNEINCQKCIYKQVIGVRCGSFEDGHIYFRVEKSSKEFYQ